MRNDTFNRGTRNTKNILKTFDINGCFFFLAKFEKQLYHAVYTQSGTENLLYKRFYENNLKLFQKAVDYYP